MTCFPRRKIDFVGFQTDPASIRTDFFAIEIKRVEIVACDEERGHGLPIPGAIKPLPPDYPKWSWASDP